MSTLPPVCHIPPVEPTTQPSPRNLPSIPAAQPTIASLVATVNAMRQVINYLSGSQNTNGQNISHPNLGQIGQQNTGGPQRVPGPGGSTSSRWNEVSRVEEKERVFQNNDKSSSNWVDVKRINQLKMQDRVTGEMWTWKRDK